MNEDRTKSENADFAPGGEDLELPPAMAAGLRRVYGGEAEVPAHVDVAVILEFRARQRRRGGARYTRKLASVAAGLALAVGAIYFTARPFMRQDQAPGVAIAPRGEELAGELRSETAAGGARPGAAASVPMLAPGGPTGGGGGGNGGAVAMAPPASAKAMEEYLRKKGLPTGRLAAGVGSGHAMDVIEEVEKNRNRGDIDKSGRTDVLDALRLALTIRRVSDKDSEGLSRLGYKTVDPPEAVLDLAWDFDKDGLVDQGDVDSLCRQVVRLGG